MKRLALLALAATAGPAGAEVRSAAPSGFEIVSKVIVPAAPAEAYARLGRIGEWWSPEHTYSGKAGNLKLEPRAGGCFCETMDGGGWIEHLRVVYAQPGRTLRLQGGLGPLQAEAAAGTLTWELKPAAGGTEVTQSYVVGGYIRGGADKLAPIVDKVMGEALSRFRASFGAEPASAGD